MRRSAEDVSKLPKWAQTKINVLQANLASAERRMEEMLGDHEETNVWIARFVGRAFDSKQCLPNNTNITFKLQRGEISARVKHGYLYINSHGGQLAAMPESSNTLGLHLIERD